jgi:CRP-like cAMP-binding protein
MEIPVMDARSPIGENHFLQRLSVTDMEELRPHLKTGPMTQGSVLHEAGQPIEHVYFPLSGMVSLLAVMKTGQQIETGITGREGLVGGSIGSGGPLAFGQATVQIAGSAYRLPSPHFLTIFHKSARFRELANGYQGIMYFQAQQSAACHAIHTVEARLCRWLLQSQDIIESDAIELTQEFLSHMLGVQRNAVSLCAHALQEAGLIEYARGSIKILNRGGLKDSACECYEAIHAFTDKALPPQS